MANAEILTSKIGPVVRYGRDFKREASFFDSIFRLYLSDPRVLLDAGCGDCLLTRRLAQYGYQITAFDCDERMGPRSRKLPENARFVRTGIAEVKGKYDGLVANGSVINYSRNLGDAKRFLLEANRLLKRWGILIFEVPNYDNPGIGERNVRYRYGSVRIARKAVDVYLRSIVRSNTNRLIFEYVVGKTRRTESMILLVIRHRQLIGLLEQTGYRELASYGDYMLTNTYRTDSKRMIVVAKKTRVPPT